MAFEPNSTATTDGTGNGEATSLSDSLASGLTSSGAEFRATLVGFTRHEAVFEVYGPQSMLRVSEVLSEFRILLRDRVWYVGRAVVTSLVNAGVVVICQVSLDEQSWTDVELTADTAGKAKLRNDFKDFLAQWERVYLVSREYKLIIADLHSFFSDLRLWLDQVELNIRAVPDFNRVQLEQEVASELRESVSAPLNHLFDRFEEVSSKIEEDRRPSHRAFGRRQMHPLMMCAPFPYRCYNKPLGFAGDYEMMNMILRNGLEGSSLFAKLINSYLLDQGPPRAVRSRVGFLKERIIEETGRVARSGKIARIYNLGSGPAREVEEFIVEQTLANQAEFRLVDFNEETLSYAEARLRQALSAHHRRAALTLERKSVQQLLKSRPGAAEPQYDLIYCSGLYDYLGDRVCKMLSSFLYDKLRPGGLLVVGNFAPWTSRQHLMEHFVEWFLIYRDTRQLAAVAPEQAPAEECVVRAESSGANIFLEVRKLA
jgi:extracellular factor (EF) 3-hydroxypalmitic acid methyl ester biosynthesis protein